MNPDQLADSLEQQGFLADARVAEAFYAVPRHLFLPGIPLERTYADLEVYTLTDDEGAFVGGSDQPSQVAQMLTLAQLQPGHNVLEIGTGTGYNAALIQHIVGDDGRVTSLELDREIAREAENHLQHPGMGRVNVVNVDGAGGYAPRASYDRIISTVAIWDIPAAWLRQLRPSGLIVAPINADGLQICAALKPFSDDSLYSDTNFTSSFVQMRGMSASPPQHVYLGGGSALRLYSDYANRIDSASLHMLLSMDTERCHLGVALTNEDFWDGLVPYIMLNVPEDYQFVTYTVEGGKIVYGIHGRGFGLIRPSSASFVCADELGDTHCFAGVDAFLAISASYNDWVQAGSPRVDRMRVRLLPKTDDEALPAQGRAFVRREHNLHVWLAPVESGDTADGARSIR